MQDVILVVEYSFLVCRPLFSSGKALDDKTSQRYNLTTGKAQVKKFIHSRFLTSWARMESKWILFWIKTQPMALHTKVLDLFYTLYLLKLFKEGYFLILWLIVPAIELPWNYMWKHILSINGIYNLLIFLNIIIHYGYIFLKSLL